MGDLRPVYNKELAIWGIRGAIEGVNISESEIKNTCFYDGLGKLYCEVNSVLKKLEIELDKRL